MQTNDSKNRSIRKVATIWGVVLALLVVSLFALPPLWEELTGPPRTPRVTRTVMLLSQTENWLHMLLVDEPSMNLDRFVRDEEMNAGAKALYRIMMANGFRVDLLKTRGNVITDEDGEPMVVDAWANPMVFVPRNHEKGLRYKNVEGQVLIIAPRTDSGDWRYQLWSLGPNGLDDRGLGDDLCASSDSPQTN